jgi:hypothetical protein
VGLGARLSGKLKLLGGTPDHIVAPVFARHDERNEIAAAKAKRAERHHDDELQSLTHRNNSCNFAIFTAILLASQYVVDGPSSGRVGTPETTQD